MSIDQSIEQDFNKNLDAWKAHCRKNAMYSFSHPYLNCDAYRNLVKMGSKILPFIHDELKRGLDLDFKYELELKKIKTRVFGTENIGPFNDKFRKIFQDEEYNRLADEYGVEVLGNPGIFWCYAIKEIVPEYCLPVGKKDSGSPVEKISDCFVALKVDECKKATIKWLSENMHKYTI